MLNIHKAIIGTPIFNVNNLNRHSYTVSSENIGMSIGKRIREVRKELKLSQVQLCAKIGMKQGTLSELETGESSGTTMLASIAAALGVNPLWLETGKGDKHLSKTHQNVAEAGNHYVVTNKHPKHIQEVLEIMEALDERGQLKIKLLVEDEAARHKKLMEDAAPNLDVQLLNEVLKHGSKTQRDIINSAISSMTAEYLQQIKKAG